MPDLAVQIEKLKTEILNEVMTEVEQYLAKLPEHFSKLDFSSLKGGLMGGGGAPGMPGIKGDKGDMGIALNGKDGKPGNPGRNGRDGKDAELDEEALLKRFLSKVPKQNESELKSVKEELLSVRSAIRSLPRQRILGGGGGDTVRYVDLSSSCDGATRAFTLTRVNRVLGVFSTQAPAGGWRPEIDWTFSQASGVLTLDSGLPFIQSGQTLWIMYVEA